MYLVWAMCSRYSLSLFLCMCSPWCQVLVCEAVVLHGTVRNGVLLLHQYRDKGKWTHWYIQTQGALFYFLLWELLYTTIHAHTCTCSFHLSQLHSTTPIVPLLPSLSCFLILQPSSCHHHIPKWPTVFYWAFAGQAVTKILVPLEYWSTGPKFSQKISLWIENCSILKAVARWSYKAMPQGFGGLIKVGNGCRRE